MNPRAYQLRVFLRGINPPIWRCIEVPANLWLIDLHETMQAAFGWLNIGLFQFHIGNEWVELTEEEVAAKEASPDSALVKTTVGDVAESLPKFASFSYLYDGTAGWYHDITIERAIPAREAKPYPVCTGGERSGPPEACKGPEAYKQLLRSLRSPSRAAELADLNPELFDQAEVNEALRAIDPGRCNGFDLSVNRPFDL